MDEGLDESDDYDSQEAMDNMIEDIDRKEKNDSDEGMNEEQPQEEFHEMVPKFHIPSFVSSLHSESKNISNVGQSPEALSPRSENLETAKTEVSEESRVNQDHKTETPEEAKIVKQDLKTESFDKPKADVSEPGYFSQPKSRNSLEIENSDQPASKFRPKGSSRADGQSLTRKNSMASSIGGANMNGAGGGMNNALRSMNKKVMSLQKDLEGYKSSLDEINQTLADDQVEFTKVYDKVEEVKKYCDEVENRRQAMEMSFIKALRRNGIDKKNKNNQKVTASIDAAQIKKLENLIEKKSEKLKTVSTFVEKIAGDTFHMKEKQNSKINEIINSVKFLDEARLGTKKELAVMAQTLRGIEQDLMNNITNVHNKVISIQGPITNLISDQQRENEILNENIKKHQTVLNDVIGNYTKLNPSSKITQRKGRNSSLGVESPKITFKHQLSNTMNGFRKNSVPTHQNWLEEIPDGTPLFLPRLQPSVKQQV